MRNGKPIVQVVVSAVMRRLLSVTMLYTILMHGVSTMILRRIPVKSMHNVFQHRSDADRSIIFVLCSPFIFRPHAAMSNGQNLTIYDLLPIEEYTM